jgi:hypothetical protein
MLATTRPIWCGGNPSVSDRTSGSAHGAAIVGASVRGTSLVPECAGLWGGKIRPYL